MIASILLIILFPFNVFGLEGIHPGIELGLNYISSIYNNPMQSWETKWKFGYTVGGVIEIPISRHFDIKTGLRYLQLGNRVDYQLAENEIGAEYSGDFKIVQNYVSLPIIIKLRTVSEPSFFFQFGPEFGSLISAQAVSSRNMSVQSLGYNTQLNEEEDITDSMKPYNVCLNAGFGITLEIFSEMMTVQMEYGHGLIGTAKEDQWISNWKTREIRTSIGYLF
jgi:hypothetical protein